MSIAHTVGADLSGEKTMSDLIERDALMKEFRNFVRRSNHSFVPDPTWNDAVSLVGSMPSVNTDIILCQDCKWWDRLEDEHPYGYCRACRSGTHTERWDISIRRQCRFDFFCADAEPKEDDDES